MKSFSIIAILLVLTGGYYWYTSQSSDEVMVDEVDTAVESDAPEIDENPTETPVAAEDEEVAGEAKVFNVSGVNFAFDIENISVKEGDTVTINFESTQGFHDWVVDEFDAATEQVQAGGKTSVTFAADKAGTYEYYCSVGSHRAQGMVGTLTVE